jgi:hypothetical protein
MTNELSGMCAGAYLAAKPPSRKNRWADTAPVKRSNSAAAMVVAIRKRARREGMPEVIVI